MPGQRRHRRLGAELCCAHLQDRGPFSERQTAAVLYECLKVISTCHTNGMTHGDVKPAVRGPLHIKPGVTCAGPGASNWSNYLAAAGVLSCWVPRFCHPDLGMF